jgi:hypothetical protein
VTAGERRPSQPEGRPHGPILTFDLSSKSTDTDEEPF